MPFCSIRLGNQIFFENVHDVRRESHTKVVGKTQGGENAPLTYSSRHPKYRTRKLGKAQFVLQVGVCISPPPLPSCSRRASDWFSRLAFNNHSCFISLAKDRPKPPIATRFSTTSFHTLFTAFNHLFFGLPSLLGCVRFHEKSLVFFSISPHSVCPKFYVGRRGLVSSRF